MATLCVVWFWTQDAHAYAWMIRHGYVKCATCHTDPSGGETLTHMGRVQGQMLMSMPWGDKGPELNSHAKFLNGEDEPDNVRIGGSLRNLAVYTLSEPQPEDNPVIIPIMQADLYGNVEVGWLRAGASLGISKTKPGSSHSRAAQITNSEPTEDGTIQVLSRSHWLGIDFGDEALVRAGRLNLPFGIRSPEHTMWTRDATKTDRESDQQHGVAVALSRDSWRGEFMVILGNYQIAPDNFRERGYSGYLEYFLSNHLAVGASSMLLQSKGGPYFNPTGKRTARAAHGLMARYSPMKELGVLAEVDYIKQTGAASGYTGFVQLDYEYWQGLHGLASIEALDQGEPVEGAVGPGAGEMMLGYWVGADWFFWDHLNFRVDAVIRDLPSGGDRSQQIYGQLHYYF